MLNVQTRPIRVRNRTAREGSLISAARRLFATRGYEATTTREIAAEAGCAEGLIHRYFQGKAGLLLALIRSQVSQEVGTMTDKLQLAPRLEDEILQLVDFEVDHMWEERDFFQVIIPRAILEPTLGQVVSTLGPTRRATAIADRLRCYPECQNLTEPELQALADSVGLLGFIYGFMRPVVLGDDRSRAKQTALILAKMLVRGL